jgi:hypothetical protein
VYGGRGVTEMEEFYARNNRTDKRSLFWIADLADEETEEAICLFLGYCNKLRLDSLENVGINDSLQRRWPCIVYT